MDQLFISSALLKNINSNDNKNIKGKKGGQNLCIIYMYRVYVYFSVL